jgi:hypothetical protein
VTFGREIWFTSRVIPHARAALGAALAVVLAGCNSGPSKAAALETVQRDVTEDGSCTLPVDVLSHIKVQHATKGVCVPKEGAERARACIDALVAAGVTRPMPPSYMLAWPDEVSGASLTDVPAYERRARNLIYGTCVELVGGLRAGRFTCADVKASKVVKVETSDPTHAEVRYEREITLRPFLPAIDAACGAVSRPPGDATVAFVKSESGWGLATAAGLGAGDGGAN